MKVLLIEDDKIIWPNIKEYLEQNNCIVNLSIDWEAGLKEALKNKYDIFILDIMLPFKDWFEIAKEIRKNEIQTPIIFLTAKEDLQSKEIGFNVWWDDYLTKPFRLKELVLRIRNLTKRVWSKWEQLNKITIWDIELNLDTKEVRRWNRNIILTPKEFIILEYLMKNKSKVIPKQELLEYIWWINNDIWSDVTRTHVQSLRKKLNEKWETDSIKTIRGIWFKFEENDKK
jgi:DNA-binding response OmpR family regulator